MRQRRLFASAALWAVVVSLGVPVLAFEARVTHVRVAGARVAGALEVADLLQDKFLKLVRDGRAVFLQLEAALWEDRRVFDRIVIMLPPSTWRLDRDASGVGVVLQDQHGGVLQHGDIRQPLPLGVTSDRRRASWTTRCITSTPR